MKKILITVMVLLCFALRGYGQTKAEKQIIGKWCNPYTYQSTGELKGFEFKKGGKCSAINIPVYDLRTWKIDEEGYLIIDGKRIVMRCSHFILVNGSDIYRRILWNLSQEKKIRVWYFCISTPRK